MGCWRPRTGDEWHLDEVFRKIDGITHYLWRAVDHNGIVLDIFVQLKRDPFAAIRFFRKLLRATGRQPNVIITDKLRSYGMAKRVVMPGVAHRQHRYLNNRAENAHQPTRERERRMRRSICPARSAICQGARNHCSPLPSATPPASHR
jgi:putative transposase